MSDRLKFFRRLMSAFEGASNPQRAVERGFYVNLPNNPVGEITRRIELRPSSAHLLCGGIGSGKTTQLLLVQQTLNELEDIKAIYIDVSLIIDISDLRSGALIAIAGLELIKLLSDASKIKLREYKKTIEKIAYGNERNAFLSGQLQKLPQNIESVAKEYDKGLLLTENHDKMEMLIQAFSNLKNVVKEEINSELVFLFDGLDRLDDSNIFEFAINDVLEIERMGTGAVLVSSIVTIYSRRESILKFGSFPCYLPYLDVFESVETQKFFSDVIDVRDPENFIDKDARIFLISKSGGVLRDLMSLCQAAIEEAYVDGSEKITEKHANQAVVTITRSKLVGITDFAIKTLRKVMNEESFSPRNFMDFELLLRGHILEYKYPRQRFGVHPILVSAMENIVASEVNG